MEFHLLQVSLGSSKAQCGLESGFWIDRTVGPLNFAEIPNNAFLCLYGSHHLAWDPGGQEKGRRMQLNIQNNVLNGTEHKNNPSSENSQLNDCRETEEG